MSLNQPYQVYITCLSRNDSGAITRDFVFARQLLRRLEAKGYRVYLTGKSDSTERESALDSAEILVVAGFSAVSLESQQVCDDYDEFNRSAMAGHKRKWRIFTFVRSVGRDGLPLYLQKHVACGDADKMEEKIRRALSSEMPRNCVSDEYEEEFLFGRAEEEGASGNAEDDWLFEHVPEPLPDCAEEIRIDDEDDKPGIQGGRIRARRAPAAMDDEYHDIMTIFGRKESGGESGREKESPDTDAPVQDRPVSAPEESSKRQKVKPARINKVDFSVVAPDEVRPGKSSVIDLLMYTRSQRGIVKRTVEQAKEKSSEAVRSVSSVSVRQGSRVTALLFSDDIGITEGEQTLTWNGDALDFRFRVAPPEDYAKKQIDYGCSVLFDGIQITRLYFTIAVNSRKKAAVRFVRRDCRKAFVSYSHKDRLRVAEQLRVIQQTAPKLRFWMDNQSMTAGDVWRSAIASAIKGADVFLLFWSVSARDSSEVRKEWEYALRLEQSAKRKRKNGARFISPVPLDSPSVCPPPEELGDLHFGDPSFDENIDDLEAVRFWSVNGKNISFLKK